VNMVELVAVKEPGPFDFRWPDGIESFERVWPFDTRVEDARSPGSCSGQLLNLNLHRAFEYLLVMPGDVNDIDCRLLWTRDH
jgi:hypothetical protein